MNKRYYTNLFSGAIFGILASVVAIFFSVGGYLGQVYYVGWRYLLWPAFLLGRVGIRVAWPILPLVVAALILLIMWLSRPTSRCNRHRSFILASLLFAYSATGLFYVHLAPVPVPAFPMFSPDQVAGEDTWEIYFVGFKDAYRWGIIDCWQNNDGAFPDALREGWGHGYSSGLAEWESAIPGARNARIFDYFLKKSESQESPNSGK